MRGHIYSTRIWIWLVESIYDNDNLKATSASYVSVVSTIHKNIIYAISCFKFKDISQMKYKVQQKHLPHFKLLPVWCNEFSSSFIKIMSYHFLGARSYAYGANYAFNSENIIATQRAFRFHFMSPQDDAILDSILNSIGFLSGTVPARGVGKKKNLDLNLLCSA